MPGGRTGLLKPVGRSSMEPKKYKPNHPATNATLSIARYALYEFLMKWLREKGLPQRKSWHYQYFLITSSTELVLPSGRTIHSPRHCALVGRSGSPCALATGEYCPFCLHSLS